MTHTFLHLHLWVPSSLFRWHSLARTGVLASSDARTKLAVNSSMSAHSQKHHRTTQPALRAPHTPLDCSRQRTPPLPRPPVGDERHCALPRFRVSTPRSHAPLRHSFLPDSARPDAPFARSRQTLVIPRDGGFLKPVTVAPHCPRASTLATNFWQRPILGLHSVAPQTWTSPRVPFDLLHFVGDTSSPPLRRSMHACTSENVHLPGCTTRKTPLHCASE